MCCTAYFHRNVLPGTCNTLIYVSSFLKFISHRSLLNCMWSDILWLNFCFHGTAPICISAVAFRTPLLTACVFFLSLMYFFRKLLVKSPVWPLSWRSQSICDCLGEMDLNYSNSISNLLMGFIDAKKKMSSPNSLCDQSPWHDNRHEISSPLSQMVFFAWGWLRLSNL